MYKTIFSKREYCFGVQKETLDSFPPQTVQTTEPRSSRASFPTTHLALCVTRSKSFDPLYPDKAGEGPIVGTPKPSAKFRPVVPTGIVETPLWFIICRTGVSFGLRSTFNITLCHPLPLVIFLSRERLRRCPGLPLQLG